ncbi:porin [Paraflavisolibacter sp. H34]|uniref:porin n=1 Tax=Huijunlia imazamoxiresistens TaxID=3127457 RepID=UPI0030187BFE
MSQCSRALLPFLLLLGGLKSFAQETPAVAAPKNVYAKLGKGINFIAPDSSMSLKMGARIQTLFVAERSLAEGARTEKEMMVRRARLKFDGFAFTPKLEYKIELALSNRDNGSVMPQGGNAANIVLDAVVKYQASKNTELWFGQTKLPGNRERVNSSSSLQFVDRSLVNSLYNLDRDIGLQLHHQFHVGPVVVKDKYAVSLGQGRNITVADTGGFSYTGRVEVLPFGEFSHKGDYFESDLEREATPRLSLAAGYSYNDGAVRKGGELGAFLGESRDLKTFFADLFWKYRGWSVASEYMKKQAADGSALTAKPHVFFETGSGFNVQSGYLFPNNFELAGRYTEVTPSRAIRQAGEEGPVREYTLGLSKYFVGHSLKVQSDVSHIRNFLEADPALRFRFQVELGF